MLSIRQISGQKHLLAAHQEAHVELHSKPPELEMQGQDLQLRDPVLLSAWDKNYSTMIEHTWHRDQF